MLVKWLPLEILSVKLNCDGASKGNPGSAEIGGLLLESNHNIILGYACSFSTQTSVFAETYGVLMGIC